MARPNIKNKYHVMQTPGFVSDRKPVARITLANGWLDVRIHSVGEDDKEISQIALPPHPEALRQLAKLLSDGADEIEEWLAAR